MIGRTSLKFALKDGTVLQLEAWYPAKPGMGAPDYAVSPALKREMVTLLRMPGFALSTRETTRGRRGLLPEDGIWPVVLFSHGYASFSRQNTRQMEALAEAGYLALAVSHPGDSLTTEYGDGRLVTIDQSQPALDYLKESDKSRLTEWAQALNVRLNGLVASDSEDGYLQALEALVRETIYGASYPSAQRRTDQVVELVARLGELHHPLMNHADLSRIGLYGHSLGGIVSVAAGHRLVRMGVPIGAVVNLDAAQILLPEPDSLSLAMPACFLMGGATRMAGVPLQGTHLNRWWTRQNEDVCEINIETAAHNNFTDLGWVTPLKWLGQLGPVKNKPFADWLNGFLVAYFNHHLNGAPFQYPLWEGATLTGHIDAR